MVPEGHLLCLEQNRLNRYHCASPEVTMQTFTAVIKQEGEWWFGWIEEMAGVNCQESTREELLESLRIALRETIEFNRSEARELAGSEFSREPISA